MESFVQLPANLLEAFIPGYSTISHIMLGMFGFDITHVVSIVFVSFAILKSGDLLKAQFFRFIMRFGTCSIQIESNSDVYNWVSEWMADRGIGQDFHALLALPIRRFQSYDMEVNRGAG